VAIQDLDSNLVKALSLESSDGVLVSEVQTGGPAEQGGIERGDVILAVDAAHVKDTKDLARRIADIDIGKKIDVTVTRKHSTKTVELRVGEYPEDTDAAFRRGGTPPEERGGPDLGLDAQELTPEIARQLGLDAGLHGVLVTDVTTGSPADRAGLSRGDVIVEVNQKEAPTLRDYYDVVERMKAGETLLLLVRSGPRQRYVTVDVPEDK
jgi:serine protease Do